MSSYHVIDAKTGETIATVIELWDRWTNCSFCNADTPVNWSIPVSAIDGSAVPNNYQGEWGGVAACKDCFEKHERWSKKIEGRAL